VRVVDCKTTPSFRALQGDVVGQRAPNNIVTHVAIVMLDAEPNTAIAHVTEMAPPVSQGPTTFDVLGQRGSLTPNERMAIATWAGARMFVDPPDEYSAAGESTKTTVDGRSARTFNCAGFAVAAYRDGAGVDLIDANLPSVPLANCVVWQPAFASSTRSVPMLCPGFVLHALASPQLPFTPSTAHMTVP